MSTETPLKSVQFARIADLVGEGEIELVDGLRSIYLNDTPIQNADGTFNFTGVTASWRYGTADQEPLDGFPSVESETVVAVDVLVATPVTRTITTPDLDAVRVTLRWPGGHYRVNDEGKIRGIGTGYKVEVQSSGGGYATIVDAVLDGMSTAVYDLSLRIDLRGTSPPWDIRVSRWGDDPTPTHIDGFQFYSYTEIIDERLRYPYSAICGLVLNAKQFGGKIPTRAYHVRRRNLKVPSNYDPVTRAYTGVWDGTFQEAFSNNPAWVFYDLATDPRFGGGRYLDAAQVDKWGLYEIAQYCDELVDDGFGGTEPRFTCNLYLQRDEEAHTVLQRLASIFRGVSFWAGGEVMCSADMPADPAWVYTPANVIDGRFTYQGASSRQRHTVAIVTWNDLAALGRQQREYVEHPDPDVLDRYGLVQTEVVAFGCTSQGQAHRMGRYILFSEEGAGSETVTFRAGLEGCRAAPGWIIETSDPTRTQKRQGGRLNGGTTTTLQLDAPVTLEAGAAYQVSVVLPEQSPAIVTRGVTNAAGETQELTLASALPAAPLPGAVWLLTSDQAGREQWRVIGVAEAGPGEYEITALRYLPDKFARVEADLHLDTPRTDPLNVTPLAVGNLTMTEYNYRNFGAIPIPGTQVVISWDASSRAVEYEVSITVGDDNTAVYTTENPTYTIGFSTDFDAYSVSVVAIGPTGLRSQPATVSGTIVGPDGVPDDIQNFDLTANANGTATLTWDAVPEAAVRSGGKVRIKLHEATDGSATWATATPLADADGTDESIVVPLLIGTYMAKAVTSLGSESINAATQIYNDTSYVPPKSGGGIAISAAATIGMPMPWPFAPPSSPPGGVWLDMDGSLYNYDDYPTLGAYYGASPGGTFNIADWRNVPVWGVNDPADAGTETGADSVDVAAALTLSVDASGDNGGWTAPLTTSTDGAHTHGGATGGPSATINVVSTLGTDPVGDDTHTHSISSDGGHSHTVNGGNHTHGLTKSGSIDRKPKRRLVRWMQRAS